MSGLYVNENVLNCYGLKELHTPKVSHFMYGSLTLNICKSISFLQSKYLSPFSSHCPFMVIRQASIGDRLAWEPHLNVSYALTHLRNNVLHSLVPSLASPSR